MKKNRKHNVFFSVLLLLLRDKISRNIYIWDLDIVFKFPQVSKIMIRLQNYAYLARNILTKKICKTIWIIKVCRSKANKNTTLCYLYII